jgi:amino acid adenylation domain-containing protein
MDTASPAARATRMIDQCTPRVVLAAPSAAGLVGEVLAALPAAARPIVAWMKAAASSPIDGAVKASREALAAFAETTPAATQTPEDLAYILFTSGSTGTPKGVMITHDNVRAYNEWAVSYFGIGADDRLSGHSPLHFDLSMFDLFGSFFAGAALYPVLPELNLLPQKTAEFIRTAQLTQWFSVPSAMTYLAKFGVIREGDFPALRRVLWCGEVLPTPTLIHWMQRLPHCRFTNLYGPTEATIASSFYTVEQIPACDTAAIPIGQPCAGEELLVLDEGLRALPPGASGDLYIAGVGLGPGYWRDEEKTNAAFKVRGLPNGTVQRVYKTGDLAKLGDDGQVYFLGRADTQIKSRGYRIELGEIEAALNALEHVGECAVVAIQTDGFEGAQICCAYTPSNGTELTPAVLRKALSAKLPAYMLPARWLSLPRLPKNSSGKIDRRTLTDEFRKAAGV